MTTDQRLETLTLAIGELGEIMIQTRTMVAELAAWLQQPPSNDLPEFLTRISLAIEANTAALRQNSEEIAKMGEVVSALHQMNFR